MKIFVYVNNPIIKRWINDITDELSMLGQWTIFYDLESLVKSLEYTRDIKTVIFEVEDKGVAEYAESVKQKFQAINIMAIGKPISISETYKLLQKGFCSYLDINSDALDAYRSIRQCSEGKFFLPSKHIEDLIKLCIDVPSSTVSTYSFKQMYPPVSTSTGVNISTAKVLTEKEITVCELLIKGHTYKEIANLISIPTFAVNQRTKSIYKKLGVRSRSELSYIMFK